MSNYTPVWIDKHTWRIINAMLYRYPYDFVELAEGEANIMCGRPVREINKPGGYISDPTASKAIALSTPRRRELSRRCGAIGLCLTQLRPEHYKVVCLRFWGTEDAQRAISLARRGYEMAGYNYDQVAAMAEYSEIQVKRIAKRFILGVGKKLGEN